MDLEEPQVEEDMVVMVVVDIVVLLPIELIRVEAVGAMEEMAVMAITH